MCSLGRVQRKRPLQWFLSVGEGTNQQHDGIEYVMPLPDHVQVGGGTGEEGLENLIYPTYPDISNP
jgi:hypothetical protein